MFFVTLMLFIIAKPDCFVKISAKQSGLPLDKPDGFGYNKDKESVPNGGHSR